MTTRVSSREYAGPFGYLRLVALLFDPGTRVATLFPVIPRFQSG